MSAAAYSRLEDLKSVSKASLSYAIEHHKVGLKLCLVLLYITCKIFLKRLLSGDKTHPSVWTGHVWHGHVWIVTQPSNIMELGILLLTLDTQLVQVIPRLPLTVHQYSFALLGGRGQFLLWSLWADRLIAAGAYPGFCSMKRLGVFLLPLDGMLVHRRSLPCNLLGFPNNSQVPIYTGWREAPWELSVLPKNTTQCPQLGFEPGPLHPGTSALTLSPLCLCTSCLPINFHC